MANINGRRIQDATFLDTSALGTSDATTYSTVFDLETTGYKGENYELEITTPVLDSTQLPNLDTLTCNVVAGSTATPTTVILGSVLVITGDGSDSAETTVQVRLPSDCPRYVRVQFVLAGTTGDCSAASTIVKLLF